VHVSALIAAGGRGLRFGGAQPKQLRLLGGQSILERSVDAFRHCDAIDDIVVALPAELALTPPPWLLAGDKPIEVVVGGARRRDSVANAFARVVDRADVVVVHDDQANDLGRNGIWRGDSRDRGARYRQARKREPRGDGDPAA
jgi:2-C-methyl-D-erythritol 4-phosphate cytidylyltransferase